MAMWRDDGLEWEVGMASRGAGPTARLAAEISVQAIDSRGNPAPGSTPTVIASFYRNHEGQQVVEIGPCAGLPPLPLASFMKAIDAATARA